MLILFRDGDDRDHKLSEFIGGIRAQSLKYMETINDAGIGAETFLALNSHSESLKELRLCLRTEALPHLSLLKGCTALETLKLEDSDKRTDLEKTQNDVFLEVIAWLQECTNLRNISITGFLSASSIVLPLLLEDNIHIQRLEVDSYLVKDNRKFHQALTHQRSSLRALDLKGDDDDIFRDDVEVFVDALKTLTELRELKLRGVSDLMKDEQFIPIVENLKLLEDLYISGLEVTDALLGKVAELKYLRIVTFYAISKFTIDGFLGFISKLGPGNQGIVLSVEMAEQNWLLSEEELDLVRETLAANVGGRLEYTPFRGEFISRNKLKTIYLIIHTFFTDKSIDPDVSEFEGESD